jgi:hypothetical protein
MTPTIPPGSWVLSVRNAVNPFDVGRQDIVVVAPVASVNSNEAVVVPDGFL